MNTYVTSSRRFLFLHLTSIQTCFKHLLITDLYYGGLVINANNFLIREERNIRSLYLQVNNLEWLRNQKIPSGYENVVCHGIEATDSWCQCDDVDNATCSWHCSLCHPLVRIIYWMMDWKQCVSGRGLIDIGLLFWHGVTGLRKTRKFSFRLCCTWVDIEPKTTEFEAEWREVLNSEVRGC
jgi:hypothetical protein